MQAGDSLYIYGMAVTPWSAWCGEVMSYGRRRWPSVRVCGGSTACWWHPLRAPPWQQPIHMLVEMLVVYSSVNLVEVRASHVHVRRSPTTCHCWRYACDSQHHHHCNHLIQSLHNLISYSLIVWHLFLNHDAKIGWFDEIWKWKFLFWRGEIPKTI